MDLKVNNTSLDALPIVGQRPAEESSGEFGFTLDKINNDNFMEKLNILMSDISTQGKRLTEHMDIREMKQYRALITEFMNEVVTNSHEFSRENFLDRRGRHRVYGIVKLVNQELDQLAKDLLESEKKHIAILDRIGQITGLLLDLLV